MQWSARERTGRRGAGGFAPRRDAAAVVGMLVLAGGCGFSGVGSLVTDREATDPTDGGRGDADANGAADDGATARVDSGIWRCPPRSPHVIFCADFEDASLAAPAFGWSGNSNNDSGEGVTIADTERGRALVVSVEPRGASRTVNLTQSLPPPADLPPSVDLDFDFRVVGFQIDYLVLGTLFLTGSASSLTAGPAVYGNRQIGMENASDSLHAAATAGWQHARISFERATVVTLRLFVDGQEIGSRAGAASTLSSAELKLGAFWTSANPSGGAEVEFDNVILQAR